MDFATLDLKAMDERTRSSKLYIIVNQTKQKQDDEYQSDQEEDGEMEWATQNVVVDQYNFNCKAYKS